MCVTAGRTQAARPSQRETTGSGRDRIKEKTEQNKWDASELLPGGSDSATARACRHSRSESVLTHFLSIIPVLCLCVCVGVWVCVWRVHWSHSGGDGGRETEVDFCCDGISRSQAKWALIGGVFVPTQLGFSTDTHTRTHSHPSVGLLWSKLDSSWYQQAFYLPHSFPQPLPVFHPSSSFLTFFSSLGLFPLSSQETVRLSRIKCCIFKQLCVCWDEGHWYKLLCMCPYVHGGVRETQRESKCVRACLSARGWISRFQCCFTKL